jgi:hypothetical protein
VSFGATAPTTLSRDRTGEVARRALHDRRRGVDAFVVVLDTRHVTVRARLAAVEIRQRALLVRATGGARADPVLLTAAIGHVAAPDRRASPSVIDADFLSLSASVDAGLAHGVRRSG